MPSFPLVRISTASLIASACMLGVGGCADSQVGSIKAQDGAEAAAGSPAGGRFRENGPAPKPASKPAEEGPKTR